MFGSLRRQRDESYRELAAAPHQVRFYLLTTSVAMSVYTLTLLVWATEQWLPTWPRTVLPVMAAATVPAIAVHLWSLVRAVLSNDEFLRSVALKRLLVAAVITVGILTAWGMLQLGGWAPAFPLPLVYILFFVVHVLAIPFINADRP